MRLAVAFAALSLAVLTGCGGGGSSLPAIASAPAFSVSAGSYPVTQTVAIVSSTPNANIYYTTDGTAPTPTSTLYTGPVSVAASETLSAIAMLPQGVPSSVTSAQYMILPPTVSASSYAFGQDIVGNAVIQTVATVSNTASAPAPLALALSGDPSYTLAASNTCGATLAANSMCSLNIAYDPSVAGTQTASLAVTIAGSPAPPAPITLSGTSGVLAPGVVTQTINPLVALYTITPPFPATVTIDFGPDTSYGLNTSASASTTGATPVSTFVAGMQASSEYHMRATVTLASNGLVVNDIDQTFTTGAIPAGLIPPLTASTTPGLTPQPGVELVDSLLGATQGSAFVTDLAGNVIWEYPFPDKQPTSLLYPIKQLTNGDFVMLISPLSQDLVTVAPAPAGTLAVLREIDLSGAIVKQLSMADLNAALTANGFGNLNLQYFSHDVTPLPNGHMLVLTNTYVPYTDLPGYPGVTNVVGDVVVDLDQNMNPVWVWNTFDHLDVNRHPYLFPDWTHSNAITYSADDGNFLISLRHQNWILKVNYANGTGDGSILWTLGEQGDFTLVNGTDPTDWFYAQHNPSFFSTNTTGTFTLGIMDNGDDRSFPDGTNCDVQGGALCYSTAEVMSIDESAKTATILSNQSQAYSSFAGNIELLGNNNIEFNLAGVGANAYTYEVTQAATPQIVWQMTLTGTNTYREFRIPSLYPGVTWTNTSADFKKSH